MIGELAYGDYYYWGFSNGTDTRFFGAINGWVGHDYHYWYDVYEYGRWREWNAWDFDFVGHLGSSFNVYLHYSSGLLAGTQFDFSVATSQTRPPPLTIGQHRWPSLNLSGLVPMEAMRDHEERLIPDESLPQRPPIGDTPSLPGTLEPVEVSGPHEGEVTENAVTQVETAGDVAVNNANTSPFLGEQPSSPVDAYPANASSIVEYFKANRKSAQEFWKGAVILAKAHGIPVGLLEAAAKHGVSVKKDASGAGWRPLVPYNTILVNGSTYSQMTRIAKAGVADPTNALDFGVNLPNLYNEAFHALYSNSKPQWLDRIFFLQDQYDGSQKYYMSEEAVSELVDKIIEASDDNSRLTHRADTATRGFTVMPTYGEAQGTWREYLTPQHNKRQDDPFYGDPKADEVMSEASYYAAYWILYNGEREPSRRDWAHGLRYQARAKALARIDTSTLAELRRFFAETFRPAWTPSRVDRFVKEGK